MSAERLGRDRGRDKRQGLAVSGAVKRVVGRGRPIVWALSVVAMIAGPAVKAQADEGIGGFFQQLFGGGSRPAVQPLPQPGYFEPDSPPLTVRAHKHRRPSGAQLARAKRYTPEELKSVTIYTDKTLVRGDAVMTAKGLRIFNGSDALPHTDDDFVAIASSDRMPKAMRQELTAIDVASRSDFRSN